MFLGANRVARGPQRVQQANRRHLQFVLARDGAVLSRAHGRPDRGGRRTGPECDTRDGGHARRVAAEPFRLARKILKCLFLSFFETIKKKEK